MIASFDVIQSCFQDQSEGPKFHLSDKSAKKVSMTCFIMAVDLVQSLLAPDFKFFGKFQIQGSKFKVFVQVAGRKMLIFSIRPSKNITKLKSYKT